MRRLSIAEYWESLEQHEWFYAWTEGADEYAEHIAEAKRLSYLSRLSPLHGQLYATYIRVMYAGMIIDEDDSVGNIEIPQTNKPEAA